MKKIKLLVLSLLLFTLAVPFVNAEEADGSSDVAVTEKSEVNVYVFRGEGCGFCAKALSFFEEIEEEYGKYFNLVTYEVWNDTENAELMNQMAEYLGENITGVPFIIVGEKTFPGFDESWGEEIKSEIMSQYDMAEEERTDLIENMLAGIELEKENSDLFVAIVSLVVIAGVVVFVIYARKNSEGNTEYYSERKVARKVEDTSDEVEEDKEEEEKVVVKKTTKKVDKKSSEKSTKSNGSTKKKSTNSNKKKKN